MTANDTAGSTDALYPFLRAAPSVGDSDLFDDLRRSASEKFAEVGELRASVVQRDADRIVACADEMARLFAGGGRLFAFGNGGSSTDAQSLVSAFCHPGAGTPCLPAFALANDVAVVTALANDVSFDVVFSRQLAALGRAGDIAVGLSTSGGSENVLAAFTVARRTGMLTVGLAGYDGGRMALADTIDHLFVVPSASVHRIQEAQTTVYHLIWATTVQQLQARPGP